MRLVPVDNVKPGMHLGRTIYGSAGQLILREGVELKPHYMQYLKKLGINQVYIQDTRVSEELREVEEVVAENTKVEARMALNSVFKFAKNRDVSQKVVIDEKLKYTTSSIIEELLSKKEVMFQLSEIKSEDNYLISHSVSVVALSTILLKKMNYKQSRIKKIAPGFLLMDLGTARLPEYLLKKEDELLTEEERNLIQEHPRYSYEMFKKTDIFNEEASRVIYQHHERNNGEGYPQGLKGEEISLSARIAAVADVYDALISPRPYRKPLHPYQAINYMLQYEQERLDPEIMQALFTFTAAFPVGTHVRLSNGESGIVVGNTPGYTFNPMVKVVYRGEGMEHHPQPYEINLAENLDVVVEEVVEDEM